MRIKSKDGIERCNECNQNWVSYEEHPTLCDSCLAPDTYSTTLETFAWYPAFREILPDIKAFVLEEISFCAVPISIEQIFENNKYAKMIFGSLENFNSIEAAKLDHSGVDTGP